MLFFWPNSPKREQHVNISTNKICLDLTLKYISWTFSLPKFSFNPQIYSIIYNFNKKNMINNFAQGMKFITQFSDQFLMLFSLVK